MRQGMFGSVPDPKDPPEKTVAEAEAEAEVEHALDLNDVERWRYDALLQAGYTETQAFMLAISRESVDLHRAVELAERAGPALAYQIVST